MNDFSKLGLTIVTGEVMEKSGSLVNTGTYNFGTLYPFVLLKTAEGEAVRINNLVADAHTDQQIDAGSNVTLYLKPVANKRLKPQNFNLAVAAQSKNGMGFLTIAESDVRKIKFAAIAMGLSSGSMLAIIMGLILAIPMGDFGIFLSIVAGLILFRYIAPSYRPLEDIYETSLKLREKLLGKDGSRDIARGLVVRDI